MMTKIKEDAQKIHSADFTKAETRAREILNEFDIKEPSIPVAEIAERKGITIKYFRTVGDENLKKVSGFYDAKKNTIYVNADDSYTRQTFTIAHELGHKELKHEPDKYDVLYRYATPIDKNPVEQEANSFAANLLVPEDMLKTTMKQYGLTRNDTNVLADLFGVSYGVMKYRLQCW